MFVSCLDLGKCCTVCSLSGANLMPHVAVCYALLSELPRVVSRDLGRLNAGSPRTSLDWSRSNGADFDDRTVHKRSMSWLLAAVMSVCEEDPRKCRATGHVTAARRDAAASGFEESAVPATTTSWMTTTPAYCRHRSLTATKSDLLAITGAA